MKTSLKTAAVVKKDGHLRLPPDVLRELGIAEDTTVRVEVRDRAVLLRPDFEVPAEDAWAYTAEHRAAVRRSDEDIKAGRVRGASAADLDRIADD